MLDNFHIHIGMIRHMKALKVSTLDLNYMQFL